MTQYAPTPAEIETLRDVAEAFRPESQTYTEKRASALAILDRLAPPAPEVDEATRIWREMNAHSNRFDGVIADRYRQGAYDRQSPEQISYLRNILSELIASKDAEIEQIVKRESGTVDQLEKALSELAALRAEIERLKQALTKDAARFRDCSAMIEGSFNASGILRAERARKASHYALEAEQAAEHNPAEPDILSVRAERALGQIPAPDTAPVVEVTEADITYAKQHYPPNLWSVSAIVDLSKFVATIRTEAEARGRREALEVAIEYLTNNKIPRAWELRRLMTEVK